MWKNFNAWITQGQMGQNSFIHSVIMCIYAHTHTQVTINIYVIYKSRLENISYTKNGWGKNGKST